MDGANLVEIEDLKVTFASHGQDVAVVDGVSLAIPRGKTLCLVGESGCGKSVTAKAILRVIDHSGRISGGTIRLAERDGRVTDLAALRPNDRKLRAIRGGDVAMIHQEPMAFLSPLYTIGNQIIEALRLHRRIDKADAREAAIDMLRQVRMPEPEKRIDRYTFELSGGQRQRAMIAMALICQPRLLIADEPTTALDVTTQASILDLIAQLQSERQMTVLFITHDLGVVEQIADEVAVMYLGRIVEQGPAEAVLGDPQHPYTKGLVASMPRLDENYRAPLRAIRGMVPPPSARPAGCSFHPRCGFAVAGLCDVAAPPVVAVSAGHMSACHRHGPQAHRFAADITASVRPPAPVLAPPVPPAPMLRVRDLSKFFPIKAGFLERTVGHVRAVDGVSFDIMAGETLGLVGESGCGKSTLGQTIVGLHRADGGAVHFAREPGSSIDVAAVRGEAARRLRTDIRMVFQDPTGSLNPRMRVRDIIGEVLEVNGRSRDEISRRVAEFLGQVGLSPDYAARYPHAFSGGQRQRIAIARALASDPRLIIADEAVSALDVSVQTQIINLMKSLQRRLGLTYLFISHDLGVVANISDRVAVMYAGRIVEIGKTEAIFSNPRHPYTETLLAAIPARRQAGGIRTSLKVEAGANTPANGCAFAPRCPYAVPRCVSGTPALAQVGPAQSAACLRAEELTLQSPRRVA